MTALKYPAMRECIRDRRARGVMSASKVDSCILATARGIALATGEVFYRCLPE